MKNNKHFNTTHGMRYTKIYKIWESLKTRCKNKKLKNYGAKGITYDPKWETFEGFYKDMYHRYKIGLQIDRIDSSKGYSKKNCRWVDIYVQNNNTSRNRFISFNGKRQTIAQWSKESGIRRDTLWKRLYRYNWPIKKSLTTKSLRIKSN